MTEHLEEQEIERYRQRTLPPAERLIIHDHIAECEACRTRLADPQQLQAAVASLWAAFLPEAGAEPDHLSYEQLAAYVDDELDEVDREIVESHLELCPPCEAEVRDLRAFKAEMALYPPKEYVPTPPPTFRERFLAFWRPPVRRRWVPVAVAAVAIIVMGIGFFAWKQPRSLDPVLLAAQDPRQITGIDDQAKEMILRKVQDGKPVLLASLPSPSPRLRGAVEADTGLRLLKPYPKEVLLDPQVDVEWTEVAGEQEYRVEIYSESQRGQPQAWTVKQPSVTVSLAYGETYWITVEAVGKEEEVKTSFRILRREKAEELQRLARQYARSHLLRGIFYEENGLFRKARAEYRAMSEENPDSPLAREIYQQLEKSLEPGFVFTPTR